MSILRAIRRLLGKPKTIRVELRRVFMFDGEADRMITDGWTIAPEEDHNHEFGYIYLERRAPCE